MNNFIFLFKQIQNQNSVHIVVKSPHILVTQDRTVLKSVMY